MKSLLERFRSRTAPTAALPTAALPAAVMPSAVAAPVAADHSTYRDCEVLLGMGPNRTEATWKPARDAHLLITGSAGEGKTACAHGVIQQLAQAGWRVWVIDTERSEFAGYEEWCNVEFLAQHVDAQIRLIHLAHQTMKERYALLQAEKTSADEFDPIVLVINQTAPLLAMVDTRYAETRTEGMSAKAPVLEWLKSIARLGRSAKIHVVLDMQRPDATIIDGELRDNFGARISMGQLSRPASIIMWDEPLDDETSPGAAVSLIEGRPTAIQPSYNTIPDPGHRDYHPGIVAAMTPAVELHSRTRIQPVMRSIPEDENAGKITWANLLEAALTDSTGHKIDFDPVASEESRRFRAGNQPSPAPAHRHLQSADSFADGLALFPVPATSQH